MITTEESMRRQTADFAGELRDRLANDGKQVRFFLLVKKPINLLPLSQGFGQPVAFFESLVIAVVGEDESGYYGSYIGAVAEMDGIHPIRHDTFKLEVHIGRHLIDNGTLERIASDDEVVIPNMRIFPIVISSELAEAIEIQQRQARERQVETRRLKMAV